jgi:hypothetical protein
VDDAIAVVDGFRESIVELLVELIVRVKTAHWEKQAAKTSFEKQAILFVRNTPSNFAAHLVQSPFASVEGGSDLLFEDLEFTQLREPFLAALLIGTLKVYPLLHEFEHLLIEQPHLDNLTMPGQMLAGAVSTHQDVLLLEASRAGADFMRFQVVLGTHLRPQNLHE